MPILKVIIATSSAAELQRLRTVIATDQGLRLTAQCPGLMETYTAVEHDPPDIVLISRDLTLSPEFEVMRALFEALDVRWVVIDRSAPTAMRTANGMVPLGTGKSGDLFDVGADDSPAALLRQIHAVTHAARRAIRGGTTLTSANNKSANRLILIGASTGGVDALVTVLSSFTADCPPTMVVQHTGKGFGAGLVQLLALRCRAQVVGCKDGLELTQGMVCIAAGSPGHAVFTGFNPGKVSIAAGEPVSGHTPSIDRMFLSAVPVARRVSAAILTGMGSDGASGLLALRKAGATTFAQDAESSVVYGMPRVAWENGGAERQLPLNRIGPALLQNTRVPA